MLVASAAACGGGAKSPETASQILDRALEAPAGFHESDLKAVGLFSDGKFDEAFAIHQQWVDKHPNFAEAHYSLAEAHRLRGNQLRREKNENYRQHLEKALTHYRRYHELATGDDPKIRARALGNLTEILSAEGLSRLADAESTARQWVKEAPDDLSAHDGLAGIQREAGRADEGLATLRAAGKAAATADERSLYATYLLGYLESAPNLDRDATRTALDELEAIVEASLRADPKDTIAVEKQKRALRLRAERKLGPPNR